MSIVPTTLDELLRIDTDRVSQIDIARMNLLCSVGLPGVPNLNVDLGCEMLDDWAQHIGQITESQRHLLLEHRDEFENSEPLWRLFCIGRIIGDNIGITYCEAERDYGVEADWKRSDRHLLHGVLGPERHGTCSSLPVLVTAIGRRLGYPMKLVHSPGHVFSRWDGVEHPNPAWRERRNFEFRGECDSPTDEHYYEHPVRWTVQMRAAERRRRIPLFLRSLTPAEELASFLVQRGHALEAYEMFDEAISAYATAIELAPHNDGYHYLQTECRQLQLAVIGRSQIQNVVPTVLPFGDAANSAIASSSELDDLFAEDMAGVFTNSASID